jgi:hypothetical protein
MLDYCERVEKQMFNIKHHNFSLVKLTSLFLLTVFFIFQSAQAQLSAKFYTNTLEANIGDEINLQLKINPSADQPIYTVSADLIYDPNILEYVSSGYTDDSNIFGLQKPPYFLEDTENGMIRLTAGFPTGANTLTSFTNYKFIAKSTGTAKIYIQSGKALNAESTDIGLQQKEITINVGDGVPTGEALPPEVHNIDLSVDILGPLAIYKEESYIFPIETQGTVGDTSAVVKIYVYNEKTELFYSEEKVVDPNLFEPLYFTIPADTLEVGNYVISAEAVDSYGQTKIIAQKKIGVLSNGQTWVTKNKHFLFPGFIFVAIVALIHHLARERDLYFKLAEMKVGRKKVWTLKNVKKISKKKLKSLGEY